NNTAAYGGGLYNAACGCGNVTLTNSTLSGNYASYDGGGIDNAAGTVNVINSIVAGNAADYTAIKTSDIAGLGTTTYAGTNLFTPDGVAAIFASVTTVTTAGGQAFQAGELANNGGPTNTIAIKVGGPAYNKGSNAAAVFDDDGDPGTPDVPIPTDARGLPRLDHGLVDVGALEHQNIAPVAAALAVTGDKNTAINGTVTATDAENDPLAFSLAGTNGGAQHGTVGLNADGTFTYTPAATFAGTDSFSFRANDGAV